MAPASVSNDLISTKDIGDDLKFVSRLLAVGKSRNIDRKDVLTYSKRKFPLPIATFDGKLSRKLSRKHPNSSLIMHVLKSYVEDPAIKHVLCT